ncbi:hypothetical protein NP493_1218g00049 [Ridgeia piscesae]|uniref:Splicing factor 3A subunit 2 n=1 Tax=Ridgeia piscesae TaxID=27915 RepID=A0AAD9KCS7_RIDPI|nr:hypothetical protein NP493_1218g00049 [Ridgeia piscesae]
MDFQHRAGGKTGTGGVASASDANRDRRERLRQLALETIDINKDPYFMKNHLGSYECKLCLTLHNNEGSYLAHTQGKKHQANLARRAAKEAKDAPAQPAPEKAHVDIKKFVKIGRPGYKVTKQRDPESGQQSLLFQIDYPEIVDGVIPRHRFMAAYEQKVEPPDRKWQYLLFAAEPYETIGFKVPSREVDKDAKKFWSHWNLETKQFFLQFAFKNDPRAFMQPPPKMPPPLKPPQQNVNPPPAPPAGLPPPPMHPTSRPMPNFMPPPPSGRMPPPPPGGLPPPPGGLPPPPRGMPPPPPSGLPPPPPRGLAPPMSERPTPPHSVPPSMNGSSGRMVGQPPPIPSGPPPPRPPPGVPPLVPPPPPPQ